MEDLDFALADPERFAIDEEMIEVAPVRMEVERIEDGTKDPLDILDVLADADLRAGLRLDIERARQMIGMGMGLRHPFDRDAGISRGRQDGLDRADIDLTGCRVIVRRGGSNPDARLSLETAPRLLPLLAGTGLAVGLASAFFGIGGGSLIVPGLIGATAMPIVNATSSSLVSVTVFGMTTAASYAASGLVNWWIAGLFIIGGLCGSLGGTYLAGRLAGRGRILTLVFAGIVIAAGLYVSFKGISAFMPPAAAS